MKKILIDTDPGVDDALALVYANREAHIKALTTVGGNASQEKVLRNTNYIADAANIRSSIYRGAEKPLDRELETASSHGDSGFGNISPGLEYEKSEGEAIQKIIQSADRETDLLTLGPLTNIAKALEKEPELLEKYKSVTIMGGSDQHLWKYQQESGIQLLGRSQSS